MNPFTLKGKTILVTGASSGIGKASAITCTKLGANVVITGRNQQRLQETFDALVTDESSAHRQIIADLTDEQQLSELVSALGVVDGVVLCAGKGLTLPFQFATREKFDDLFNINFFYPVELLRNIYKKKLISKGGSVVTISSMGGTHIYSGGNSIYGASKSALDSIMKFCAKEFAARKVRVNTICPGMVDTPLIHRGTVTEEQLQEDMQRYPLKRYGQPEDIANAVAFLLSDASAWITGTSMIVDGGLSIN